jgi:hypothetical protein
MMRRASYNYRGKIFADQIAVVAHEVGLKPREFRAVTWLLAQRELGRGTDKRAEVW